MGEGESPVGPDEPILRRVPVLPGYLNEANSPPLVEPLAFRPTSKDTDGLSFYLERFTSVETLANSGGPDKPYAVTRLRAGDLFELKLSLLPSQKEGDLPGHLLLPEITTQKNKDKSTKSHVKEVMKSLADLANRDVAHDPSKR